MRRMLVILVLWLTVAFGCAAVGFAQDGEKKDDWLQLLGGGGGGGGAASGGGAPAAAAAVSLGPAVSGAQVEVQNYQGVEMRVGPEPRDAKTRPLGWLRMPSYLEGATVYSKTAMTLDDIEGGISKLRVKKAGWVVIACHLGYEGNLSGGWRETTLTYEQLLGLGFKPIGWAVSNYGREFVLLAKEMQAGTQMDLRVNKHEPPYVITKPSWNLPDAAGAAAAVSQGAVSARPVAFNEPRAPSGPWAVNRVFEFTSVKITAQVRTVEGQSLWRKIPDTLKEADIFSIPAKGDAKQGAHGNAADFAVERDGTVYIACQPAKGAATPQTVTAAAADVRLSHEDLVQGGWTHVGEIQDDKENNYQLFRRDVRAGESYRIRVSRTVPVFVIVNGRKS